MPFKLNLHSSELSIDDFGIITIMYHRFEENKYPSTNIKIKNFKEHISLIKKDGIKFVNPSDFENELNNNKNVRKILIDSINLMKTDNNDIEINLTCSENLFIHSDKEQMSRTFINLIKNSIESIKEKSQKNPNFIKKINIEIDEINDYIHLNIIDNGIGFNVTNLTNLAKPYYTTKKNGSGLGLSIVVKIINDHNGTIDFLNHKNGAKIKIVLPKINVS